MLISRIGKGYRQILTAGAFLGAGLLSVAGTIDLTPLVSLFVKNPAYLGAAMCGVGLLLGWLRYITTTPMFRQDHEDDPKHGLDAGA